MEQEQVAPVVPEEIQPIQKPRNTKKVGMIAAAVLLVLAVPLTITTLSQQTVSRNNAAGKEPTPQLLVTKSPMPAQTFKNINSSSDSLTGVNPDGSMGPQTSSENWSNTLPLTMQGKLVVAVGSGDDNDEMEEGHASGNLTPRPSREMPTEAEDKMQKVASGTGTPGWQGKDKKSGVKSLIVTISKVEVHVVNYGNPTEPTRNPSLMPTVHPTLVPTTMPSVMPTVHVLGASTVSVMPTPMPGPVDHWETLTLPSAVVVDLMHVNSTSLVNKLGLTSLAAGKYNEIRLYVKNANVVMADGTTSQATIPGKYNIVKIVQPFMVMPGVTTTVTLTFDPMHSLVNTNGAYILKPVVSHMDESR